MMQTTNYKYFTESLNYDIEDEEDIRFMSEFKDPKKKISLISKEGDKYKINFVGEVKTPNCVYFSFPKNVYKSDISENELDKYKQDLLKILTTFKKSPDGKSLTTKIDGDYNSERVYFDRLKSYFLDFITYEFIYPEKTNKIHSNTPQPGARISVFDTIRNRKRFGTGITYKVKDVSNSDDWMLDDIYYHTIKTIEERIGANDYEIKEIQKMYDYLISEDYFINKINDNGDIISKDGKILLNLNNVTDVISMINKSDVGVIHLPIKNTLLEYYQNRLKASSINSVNVIFTINFEKVWEMMVQKAVGSVKIDEFGGEKFVNRFNKYEITEKFIPILSLSEYSKKLKIIEDDSEPNESEWIAKRGNRHYHCVRGRKLEPDIFVIVDDNRQFIGDSKYYQDPSDSNYDKEFYLYNDAQNHKYPMVIFALPENQNIDKTTVPRNGYRRSPIESGFRELILITVCVTDLIEDALTGSRTVIDTSINLISKYTRKPEWQ